MRKLSLFLLLATSAVPAMAQRDDDGGDRQSSRSSQAEQSEKSSVQRAERPERPQRAERSERREAREQPQRQMQVERQQVERQQGNDPAVAAMRERYQQAQQQQAQQQQAQQGDSRSERIQRYQQQQQAQQQQARQQQAQEQQAQEQQSGSRSERIQRYQQRRLDAQQQRVGDGELAPRERRIRPIPLITPQAGQTGPVRDDVRSGRRYDRDDRNRWSNHWRSDHRYDWRRHRDRHRSIFHIGFYYDPFGYSYRRFNIGSYLYQSYYQSNYWINDPWRYRLPPAYGQYRWVRYHDDAVMIDTWTGEVVDVIHGFFW